MTLLGSSQSLVQHYQQQYQQQRPFHVSHSMEDLENDDFQPMEIKEESFDPFAPFTDPSTLNSTMTAGKRIFTFYNNCSNAIFIGALAAPGQYLPENGGFQINKSKKVSISMPTTYTWSGRFWARTGCSFPGNCDLPGDCGPKPNVQCGGIGGQPSTLAEFTLDINGKSDFYDVSLVDGYNVPITITPVSGTYNGKPDGAYQCTTAGKCVHDVIQQCDPKMKMYNKAGTKPVGCLSACSYYKTEQYCCSNTPSNQCKAGPIQDAVKKACPGAYSYAYDDHKSTFTCQGTISYDLTFCAPFFK